MSGYSDQHTVSISDFNISVSLLDRTLGFNVTNTTGIGELGSSRCSITFNNSDGFFTPAEGGGIGEYRHVDWHMKVLTIGNQFGGPMFQGVIESVEIEDNGINSTVTMTGTDWLSAATSPPSSLTSDPISPSLQQMRGALIRAAYGPDPGLTPVWGEGFDVTDFGDPDAEKSYQFIYQGTGDDGTGNGDTYRVHTYDIDDVTAHDIISTLLLPAGPLLHITGFIALFRTLRLATGNDYFLSQTLVSSQHTIPLATSFLGSFGIFYFDNTDPSTASGGVVKVPFRNLSVGYSDEMLANVVTVESGFLTPNSFTSTNSESVTKYGSRARSFTGTAHLQDEDVEATAHFWTERASKVRYAPMVIETSDTMIQQRYPTGTNGLFLFGRLCSKQQSSWSRAIITFTPTGGNQVTVPMIVKSQTYIATPQETIIRFELLPGVDWYSLRLDDPYFGFLGGTFETYEDPDVLYDEVDELYDGVGASGNRLG